MRFRILVAGLLLPVASVAQAWEGTPQPDEPFISTMASIWDRAAAEPSATPLRAGDQAPAFSYLAPDGKWHQFSELAARGPILLLFGAKATDLDGLMVSRAMFAELGITPAIVLQGRAASTTAAGSGLACPLIRDPMGAIADLFSTRDPRTLQHAPSYFVLDGKHKIRALHRGLLPTAAELVAASAHALGRPLPRSAMSTTED